VYDMIGRNENAQASHDDLRQDARPPVTLTDLEAPDRGTQFKYPPSPSSFGFFSFNYIFQLPRESLRGTIVPLEISQQIAAGSRTQ
jgi:hypothetical protein